MILTFAAIVLLFIVLLLTLAVSLTGFGVAATAAWWLAVHLGEKSACQPFSHFMKQVLSQLWGNSPVTPLRKWYTWEFPTRPGFGRRMPGARFFIELPFSRQRYMEYHQRPRELDPQEFDNYVTVSIPEITALAAQLRHLAQEQHYSAYDQLCNTLAFVQQTIRYTDDLSPQTGQLIEYPKYPLETLVEKKGDCEDQAILAAALLTALNYQVALLILPIHVALGVAGFEDKPGSRVIHPATGMRYLYAETTAPNWLPGEVPPQFRRYLAGGQFEVLPVIVKQGNISPEN
jgi:transglutaminase-like putative cysteine protease